MKGMDMKGMDMKNLKQLDMKAFEEKKKKLEACQTAPGKMACLKAAADSSQSQMQILKPIIYLIGLAILFGVAFFVVYKYLGNPKKAKP